MTNKKNKKNTIRFLRDEKENNYIIIDDFSDLIIGKIFIKNGGVEGFIEIGGKRFNAKTYCADMDFAIDRAVRDTKRHFEKEFNLYTNT